MKQLTKNLFLVYVNNQPAILDSSNARVQVVEDYASTKPADLLKAYFKQIGRAEETTLVPIVRYIRNNLLNEVLTIVATLDYDAGTMTYGWALCTAKDNFNRAIGREIASRRLREEPITIPYMADMSIYDNISYEGMPIKR